VGRELPCLVQQRLWNLDGGLHTAVCIMNAI
jgi:hypothetical protein